MIAKSVGIHDGSFHADEVTACALLLLFDLIHKDKIFRTREEDILAKCEYVCDVGGIYDPKKKRFDHHQSDYVGELSSAGMVLQYLLDQKIIQKDLFSYLRHFFIKGVDAHDIGNVKLEDGICTFSQVITNFLPIEYGALESELFKCFMEALDFTHDHIKRLCLRFQYLKNCRSIVKEKMDAYRDCLIFDKAVAWIESFFELGGEQHPALFVIMPSQKHWKLRGIPPSYQRRMEVRLAFPQEWAGKRGKELEKLTNIKGAIFCHKSRFITIWETKEAAMQGLAYMLQKRR